MGYSHLAPCAHTTAYAPCLVAHSTKRQADKFKIPVKGAPGRLTVMVLTTGKEPTLIEQPVKVEVEEQ